jgi:Ca2+:H+ antiporter
LPASRKAADAPHGGFAGRALLLLLVFIPIAALARLLHWGGVLTFVCAALAIVPLAGLMGSATERIADRLGAGFGGLLNATLGNAAELIIALVALTRGYHDVVKASLTGSIIGNALLVLGAAMLAGGARRERQTFDRTAAAVSSTLLAIAAVGLVIPAMFHFATSTAVRSAELSRAGRVVTEQHLSLELSCVLFAVYLLSLVFTLVTHRHLYEGGAVTGGPEPKGGERASLRRPILTLAGATVGIAVMSELLVGAVEEASHALGLTQVFVGVIVVAIIGNAAEHSAAVVMAIRNRIDLALHIAIGSSIQIALFVAPVLVFASYALGPHPMDLRFTPFEVLAVAIAVGIVNLVAQDGESNWLEGALLLTVYAMLGLAFYWLP